MGDAELMVRFGAGDPAGITDLYRAYGRLVYAVAHRVLGDAGLAQDATRETLLQAHRLAPAFDPNQGLAPWLATIASRTAIDVHRRNRHRTSRAEPVGAQPDSVTPTTEQAHHVWAVRRTLDGLPEQDRELIRLLHHRKLSYREISQSLDIPLGEVKTRSDRAHRELARQLGLQGARHDLV